MSLGVGFGTLGVLANTVAGGGGSGGVGGPWRPNLVDVPSLKAWYDPTDPTRMSLDGNGGVEMFIPTVPTPPAPFVLEQPGETLRPVLVDFNGKSVLYFADGARWLARAAAPLADRHVGLGVVMALYPTDITLGTAVFQINRLGTPSQRVDILRQGAAGLYLYRYGTFGGDFGQSERTLVQGQWVIWSTFDQLHWINGGAMISLGAGSLAASSDADLELGRFAGVVGHFLILSGPAITVADIRKLEGFAAWDLGIEAILVPGHPYRDQAP